MGAEIGGYVKQSIIVGIFSTLLLSTTAFAQSDQSRDCARESLLKNPLVALSCANQLRNIFHVPAVTPRSELTRLMFTDLSPAPLGRFTVPFLFRQWHVTAVSGQTLDLPNADIMREGVTSCAMCESHRGWATQQFDNVRYFKGDETGYQMANNNLLFDFRFSFYGSTIRQ